jgi:rhodanese-related sulfurtransferase
MKKHVFTIVVSVFIGILLIAAIAKKLMTSGYSISAKEQASLLISPETSFSLYDLFLAVKSNDPSLMLIDIRSESDYANGRLPNAISIPIEQLFSKENKEYIAKQSSKVRVLYGHNESQATLALSLLLQKGYTGFKVLKGGYDIARKHVVGAEDPSYFFYSDEKKKFDFGKLIPSGTKASQASGQIEKVETVAPRGGC